MVGSERREVTTNFPEHFQMEMRRYEYINDNGSLEVLHVGPVDSMHRKSWGYSGIWVAPLG